MTRAGHQRFGREPCGCCTSSSGHHPAVLSPSSVRRLRPQTEKRQGTHRPGALGALRSSRLHRGRGARACVSPGPNPAERRRDLQRPDRPQSRMLPRRCGRRVWSAPSLAGRSPRRPRNDYASASRITVISRLMLCFPFHDFYVEDGLRKEC